MMSQTQLGSPSDITLLRTVLGLLQVRDLHVVETPRAALDALCSRPFDAIFCDVSLETLNDQPFIVAARRTQGVLNPTIPLFMVCPQARRYNVEQACDWGATDVLTHPLSAEAIARKLAAAMLLPRSFTLASTFFGPDRRTRKRDEWGGEDRRHHAPKKATLPGSLDKLFDR